MLAPAWAGQSGFDVRFEWGTAGVEAVGDGTVVIVDVLRFTTAVEAGTSRGALVYPFRWHDDDSARDFARTVGAELAESRTADGPSLSPISLLRLMRGDAVVLPSPNGSTCAALAHEAGSTVVAACLRNAEAVAGWAQQQSAPIIVIACGERWPDGSLRPALEDFLGAGAVLSRLGGAQSPEARSAAAAWLDAQDRIETVLLDCSSGRELSDKGWRQDVLYAAKVDISTEVPILDNHAFRALHVH